MNPLPNSALNDTSTTRTAVSGLLCGFLLLSLLGTAGAMADPVCNNQTLAPEFPETRLKIDGDVVRDTHTGLMWRRCFEGKSGKACEGGELAQMSWPGAFQYIEAVNADGRYTHTNWRLPNIKELGSIADLRCSNPALDPEAFPGAPVVRIWSSTPYRFYPHFSWYVDTKDMLIDHIERSARYSVLLVRDDVPGTAD